MAFWQNKTGPAHTLRGIAAVLTIVVYLFAGFAHSLCATDVANPTGATSFALASDEGGAVADHGLVAGHHCHGCFSVSVPAPFTAVLNEQPVGSFNGLRDVALGDRATGIDPPPPKLLT